MDKYDFWALTALEKKSRCFCGTYRFHLHSWRQGKAVLVHAMKAYSGAKVWLHPLNLVTRWGWVVSFTPRKNPGIQIEGRFGPTAGPDGFVGEISYPSRDSKSGLSLPIFRVRCYTGGCGGLWAEARLRCSSSVQDDGWSPVQLLYWKFQDIVL